ncbi:hypothetical protein F5Y08DRAFT_241900 [Xylaria arbuscula]|nr:hypothetical protein F5Y08DRAFT_241900 [Xylaria arbuscula]
MISSSLVLFLLPLLKMDSRGCRLQVQFPVARYRAQLDFPFSFFDIFFFLSYPIIPYPRNHLLPSLLFLPCLLPPHSPFDQKMRAVRGMTEARDTTHVVHGANGDGSCTACAARRLAGVLIPVWTWSSGRRAR